ncbi:hypothetical protein BCR39DRAFT_515491 [Naematelia encephala]|uniref:Uncharacterized protein n=1 Tax=Naematelia encephala TaxID=71784 RepID=A0A1Y2BJF1_9TREE|nr:hypothetical protein BCR39DRAFT_515491 [Naematelia encephala]
MTQTIPCSLRSLPSHSIFLSPSGSAEGTDDEWELVEPPTSSFAGQKVSRMVMRDRDLILAVGSEVRISSVGNGEAWSIDEARVGWYKTLKTSHPAFPIQQLILSPSGRLLAVIGVREIAVIVLPNLGPTSTSSGELKCRSFMIDGYLYSSSSKTEITKVSWHPWGAGGNSLWILTSDGKLREYDILQPEDPAQEFSFLPEHTSSSSRFTAVDPWSRHATSFAFSTGTYDFSPLMVYVLMGNGDVYGMGPILPLHTEIPLGYLQGLNAYTELRARQLSGVRGLDDPEAAAKLGRAALQSQWVESLVKQVKQEDENRRAREEGSSSPLRRGSLLGHGRSGSTSSIDARSPPAEGTVRIHPPHLTEKGGPAPGVHRPMIRQGPIMFTPGPREDEEDEEQVASDIIIFDGERQDYDGTASGHHVFLGLAWSSGRVDIGVMLDQVEPRWISSRDESTSVPTLPVIESIMLSSSHDDTDSLSSPSPYFMVDPVNPDTVFVQHPTGVASISISPVLEALKSGHLAPCKCGELVESTLSNPIVGFTVLSNITLGYSLLALSGSHQLAAVELEYRVAELSDTNPDGDKHSAKPISDKETRSLLLTSPLDYGKTLCELSEINIKQVGGITRAPLQSVCVEVLKTFGTIHNHLQSCVRRVLEISGVIEQRLDLEIQEYQRQIRVLKECQVKIAGMKEPARLGRVEALLEEQASLSDRLDRVVTALAGEYRPQLGEVEKKWFEELERLKMRIRGGALSRGKGMSGKVQLLKEQLASLKPDIEKQKQQPNAASTASSLVKVDEEKLGAMKDQVTAKSEELGKLARKLEEMELKVEEVELDVGDE